jgi:hypothetical protein
MININIVAALPDVRYRQRVQKRLTRLRKRLLAFVIKANPECFDDGGRLAPGCFPARIPPEAANLHGLMLRAECKLAMIRSHAECVWSDHARETVDRARTSDQDRTRIACFDELNR